MSRASPEEEEASECPAGPVAAALPSGIRRLGVHRFLLLCVWIGLIIVGATEAPAGDALGKALVDSLVSAVPASAGEGSGLSSSTATSSIGATDARPQSVAVQSARALRTDGDSSEGSGSSTAGRRTSSKQQQTQQQPARFVRGDVFRAGQFDDTHRDDHVGWPLIDEMLRDDVVKDKKKHAAKPGPPAEPARAAAHPARRMDAARP